MARGRPQDPEQQEKVKSALIAAVKELLCDKAYKSISIREIAGRAGTYSAMISYYFENKEGLVKAMLLRTADERKIQLAAITEEVVADSENSINILVNRVITLLLREPWLFRLFQDELMLVNHEFRNFFSKNFAQVVISELYGLFAQLQQKKIIRDDLELKYLVPSFMSLISFPIMARPVLGQAIGIDTETLESSGWQEHTSQLLISHLKPRN